MPTYVLAVVVMVALSGCAPTRSTSPDAGGSTITEVPADERQTVDDFEAALLDGSTIDASLFDDAVTVVNVWGSWCGPCRVEAPALRQVSRAYADQDVQFVGLNVRDNDAAATAFEDKFHIPYPSVTSSDSPRVSLAFGGLLTTAAVPMTVVVDPERRVAARVVGAVTAATLRALLDAVLTETRDR